MRALRCLFIIVLTEARRVENPTQDGLSNPASSFVISQDDDMSETIQLPVPFGHIYKDGFGDPSSDLKTPVDMLEWSMRHPRTIEEAEEFLRRVNPDDIEFYRSRFLEPQRFVNTRDKFMAGMVETIPSTNKTDFKWFDLAELQMRNVANPPPAHFRRPDIPNNRMKMAIQPPEGKDFILPGRFEPAIMGAIKTGKFTTCDDFGSRAYFYPKDIVNLCWVPFYIWSIREFNRAIVHKYTYATKKIVSTYRALYQQNKAIDWDKPKLVMKGMNSFLLVAADRRGLFHALSMVEIPKSIPKNITLPYASLRMKIEDPYLVMMFCEEEFATIMAVEGNEPPTDKEKQAEADSIAFKGPGMPVSRNLQEEKAILKAEQEKQKRLSATVVDYSDYIPPLKEPVERGPLII